MTHVDRSSYETNGFLLVPQVLPRTDIDRMREEIDDLRGRVAGGAAAMDGTWKGDAWKDKLLGGERPRGLLLESLHSLQNQSAAIARLLFDARLLDVIEQLIGPDIQLHHTKMHAKPPEVGSPFPMHQDYPYFSHEGDSMLAAILHLDDATPDNGCLCVYPGSHKLGALPWIGEPNPHLPPEDYPLSKATPVPAHAGDLLVLNYKTIHGSALNRTQTTRRILLIQMRSPLDRPLYETRRPGEGMMLRGMNRGAVEPTRPARPTPAAAM